MRCGPRTTPKRRWLALRARKPALLILDIWMRANGIDGLELLDLVKSLDPDMPVIMISGHGNIETAVSAIKRGAYDFMEKPFKSDRLLAGRAAGARGGGPAAREPTPAQPGPGARTAWSARSAAAQHLRAMIAKVAPANSRILISGPPGSGKETAARLIHAASPRRAELVRCRSAPRA